MNHCTILSQSLREDPQSPVKMPRNAPQSSFHLHERRHSNICPTLIVFQGCTDLTMTLYKAIPLTKELKELARKIGSQLKDPIPMSLKGLSRYRLTGECGTLVDSFVDKFPVTMVCTTRRLL